MSEHGPAPFPAFLDLDGRRALVVGAGPVGTRRALNLAAAGADVLVVAPNATDKLAAAAAARTVTWEQRDFRDDDLDGAWFAVTAAGVPQVDARVAAQARARRIFCVNAADASSGTATTASVATGPDRVVIAVSGGGDPGRAIAVRDAIELGLLDGTLPLRRTRDRNAAGRGRVTLLGAGPGDPGLVTVRGKAAVAEADALVVDRLAPAALWADVADDVAVIDVGKAPGRHAATQDEINDLLVELAGQGKRVVRVKGGDPFVLGRGGEEALACLGAGIAVDIIPGVTSAVSVPAAAGIPVTHRSITSSFIVASAHEGPDGVLAVAGNASPDTTLVLLMGAGRLAAIASALIAAGRPPGTPVAVVRSGWTPDQRTTTGTLGDAAAGDLRGTPPSVVVIGDVVRLREELGDLATVSHHSGHVR